MFPSVLIVFLGVLAKNSFGQIIEIGKPQFKCGDNGQIIKETNQVTEIRLPENNYALYSVNIERAMSCTDGQNCNLVSWKIIRDFETYLNRNFPNTGETGIIYFDNIMLIAGFNYLLHVTLKTPDKKIENRNYNLTFCTENNAEISILGRLDLNSDTGKFYSTLPVIINANTTFCGQFDSYYYFRWSIDKNNKKILLPGKSRELSIMSNTAKDKYVIHCEVVACDNDATILQESIQIDIQAPSEENNEGFEVFLPFKYSTISKGASIFIQSYIGKFNSNKNYKAEWSCMLKNILLDDCLGQINDSFFVEPGFNKEGNYTIILTVRTDSLEKSATCFILVLPDVSSMEFNVSFPIKPVNGIEINAKITKLKTYCTVKWVEDPSNQFGLENIPGVSTTTFNISAKDKLFLEDIMEFGHLTVTRNFKLKIPGPSRFWNGLESGNYKINLEVTCPLIQEILNKTAIYEEPPRDFFTINGQTELLVLNSPNIIESLNIFFDGNVALDTKYYFEIKKYLGSIEKSRLYKFGFVLEGLEIVFYSGIDVSNANTILPYNGDVGVETYVEVCDYNDRCSRKFGPLIKTILNENLNEREIVKTFNQLLVEENFYKLFSYAFIVLHSSGYINQREKFEIIFSTELLEKVRELSDGGSNLILSNLIKHLVGFSEHLKLIHEFMKLISQVSQELKLHTRIVREVSEDRNEEILEVFENQLNITNSSNKTEDYSLSNNRRPNMGKQISYVLIFSSLIGFVILCYIIRKLTIYPQPNMTLNDNNEYGHVFYDDM